MEALVYLIAWTVLVLVSTILRGWCLSILWGWFVVSTFGLPPLSITQAIGVSLVVSFLTYELPDHQKVERSEAEKLGRGIAISVLLQLLYLGVGWIVKQYM